MFGNMLGYWILFLGWRWEFWFMTIFSGVNVVLFLIFMRETYAPAMERILKFRIDQPLSDPKTFRDKISPRRFFHDLAWMKHMVSRSEARSAFGKAFSRPPRMFFTNPVCFIFCVYYAYLYGKSYSSRLSARSHTDTRHHICLPCQRTAPLRLFPIQQSETIPLWLASGHYTLCICRTGYVRPWPCVDPSDESHWLRNVHDHRRSGTR